MAITKPLTLDTGAVASHWVITWLAEDLQAGIIEMNVHGWLDAAAHAADLEPLTMRKLRITAAQLASAGVALDLTAMLDPVVQATLA